MDVHATTAADNRAKTLRRPRTAGNETNPVYQIPLRDCQAKDLDNLYMVGRCISGDFAAHSSYRVMGTAVAMGEGVARALDALVGEEVNRTFLLPFCYNTAMKAGCAA